ncbi:hypothetical protein PLANPX_5799 [Lacipirellula parvula]|uniref:Uncharacterized protein n=1 Tax=Lacipirellula parvula TaxID=2650471 RepID=A0A5K7XJA8_9BACT|nr:hypothetical protein PLANPX_5799 [Lacipirellula parvula]
MRRRKSNRQGRQGSPRKCRERVEPRRHGGGVGSDSSFLCASAPLREISKRKTVSRKGAKAQRELGMPHFLGAPWRPWRFNSCPSSCPLCRRGAIRPLAVAAASDFGKRVARSQAVVGRLGAAADGGEQRLRLQR